MNERKKLHFHRICWLILSVLICFLPSIIESQKPDLMLIDSGVYITDYYSSLNETVVSINLTFNRDVNSGYVMIDFYDEFNQKLETKEIYLISYGTEAEDLYEMINGKVDAYEIIAYDFNPESTNKWMYGLLLPLIIMLVASLFLNYKEYRYKGKIITVYAGWFHHTLRVDGIKCDEHNTLISRIPIYLSTTLEDGTVLEARITTSNRISLKIDNKLQIRN